MKFMFGKLNSFFNSENTLNISNLTASEGVSPNFVQDYLKRIDGADIVQIQKINYFIERELNWLDSDKYVSRKQEATNMSVDMIEKDVQKIKDQLKKTELHLLNGKNESATGVYVLDVKNPFIHIFNGVDENQTLNVIDHEIKHAVSEYSLETMDGLIKLVKSNYKNYPKINTMRFIDYMVPMNLSGNWANDAREQQVISKRVMDVIETTYGVKRGNTLSITNLNNLISDLNYQIKMQDEQNGDIILMFKKVKQKFNSSYKHKLCEMINSAF